MKSARHAKILFLLNFILLSGANANPVVSDGRQTIEPRVALKWFNVESNRGESREIRASWMGLQVQTDFRGYNSGAFSSDLQVSYYTTLLPVTPDAEDTGLHELNLQFTLRWSFPARLLNKFQVELHNGYYGNWRRSLSSAQKKDFITSLSGFRSGLALKFPLEKTITLGTNAAYTFSQKGLINAGISLTHNLSANPWIKTWTVGLRANLYSARSPGKTENWSSFELSLAKEL